MRNNIETYNAECDSDAHLWARELGLGPCLFKCVPIGAKFVFSKGDSPLTKTAKGYTDENNRRFKTGARTAVFRL